jgi:hypothetical protein
MIKLFQIRITKEIARRVNACEKVTEYTAYCDASMLGKFPGREFYGHVADLAVNDLDDAFTVGNIGPEEKITRHAPMHSVSVGDVLVTEDGRAVIVASCGFNSINWSN